MKWNSKCWQRAWSIEHWGTIVEIVIILWVGICAVHLFKLNNYCNRSWDMLFLGRPGPLGEGSPVLNTGRLGRPGDRNFQHCSILQTPLVCHSWSNSYYLTRARLERTPDHVKSLIGKWVDLSRLARRMYWTDSVANPGVVSRISYVNRI